MEFNSINFMIFFPIVVFGYYLLPHRVRYIWLLIASYYFYMNWSPVYAVLILGSTVITYAGSLIISKSKGEAVSSNKGKIALVFTIVSNLAILGYFKYANFFLSLIPGEHRALNILLPVGISFYTFQAIGYTIDVYRDKVEVERNFFRYALFVSFFPQLVAGPIERSGNLLPQLRGISEKKPINWSLAYRGVTYIVWGLFLKMVIADRLALLVDNVYAQYYLYGTVELFLATMCFTLEIYCDFASYSAIAIGAANILGITLMENFDAPFLSRSIQEHWRRWHISLSTWFKDYLYIPLGGNRRGKLRKYLNIIITFVVSGLWHGASLHFVLWGFLHGLCQVIGDLLQAPRKKIREKLGIDNTRFSYGLTEIAITFFIICVLFVIFRADNIKIAMDYLYRMFTYHDWWSLHDGSIFTLGLDRVEMNIVLLSVLLLLVTDVFRKVKGWDVHQLLIRQNVLHQILIVAVMIMAIFIYGEYGPGYDAQAFIYFQF